MPSPTKPANKAKATKAFKFCNANRDKMTDAEYRRCSEKVYKGLASKSKSRK
jgi:hypothetical protein